MDAISKAIAGMEPDEALSSVAGALKRLFRDLGKDAVSRFIMSLMEQSEGDKVIGMVHL
jgi:hypothetical protein